MAPRLILGSGMDASKLTLMQMAKTKMDWVAQRQKVLAENVANADTPNYRAKDVRALDFRRMATDARDNTPAAAVTHPGHIQPTARDNGPFREVTERKTFETSLNDNPVVVEEQVEKMSQGRSQYDFALNVIRKNMQMLRMALGRSGG